MKIIKLDDGYEFINKYFAITPGLDWWSWKIGIAFVVTWRVFSISFGPFYAVIRIHKRK